MKSQTKLNLQLYALLYFLTLPFLILAGLNHNKIMPGLNLSALAIFAPALSVVIIFIVRKQPTLIVESFWYLFKSRFKPNWVLLCVAFTLMPLILLLSFSVDYWRGFIESIEPLKFASIPQLFIIFLIGAIGEELLWTGVFLKQLETIFSWRNALLLAGAYILWHLGPFIQTGNTASWIIEQTFSAFAFRLLVIELFLYFNASPLVAILLHISYNIAWQLYPNSGSFYNPLNVGLITLVVVVCIDIARRKNFDATIKNRG